MMFAALKDYISTIDTFNSTRPDMDALRAFYLSRQLHYSEEDLMIRGLSLFLTKKQAGQ